MRIRDILKVGHFIEKFTGPNRRKRRMVEAVARRRGTHRQRLTGREKRKYRKLIKARRKQSWRGKAP
jgi:hypothetical protein